MEGRCDQRFELVRAEWDRNFAERGEVGASLCVQIDGTTVIDLWGGVADEQAGTPWQHDTVSVVWSVTKSIVSMCTHVLASKGEISLDERVGTYWPEYGKVAAKADTTVAELLCNQAALPAITSEIPPGALYDWDWVASTLGAQEPLWRPGTMPSYHAFTYGYLPGEVIRRVTGQSVGQLLAAEVAGPLGADAWLGLPEEIEPRVAPMIEPAPNPEHPLYQLAADPNSLQALVFGSMMQHFTEPGGVNTRAAHEAELPSVGGLSNGRGLATLYAPLANEGGDLYSRPVWERLQEVTSASTHDAFLTVAMRYALGFWRSIDNRRGPGATDSMIVGRSAFGHVGMGGILGLADPVERMSIGYTMNRMGPGAALNERGQSLVDAIYRSLGYRDNNPGYWTR